MRDKHEINCMYYLYTCIIYIYACVCARISIYIYTYITFPSILMWPRNQFLKSIYAVFLPRWWQSSFRWTFLQCFFRNLFPGASASITSTSDLCGLLPPLLQNVELVDLWKKKPLSASQSFGIQWNFINKNIIRLILDIWAFDLLLSCQMLSCQQLACQVQACQVAEFARSKKRSVMLP